MNHYDKSFKALSIYNVKNSIMLINYLFNIVICISLEEII